MWELLTGNIPFADLPEVTIMYKILNGARPNRDTVASPNSSPPTSTTAADSSVDKDSEDMNQHKKASSEKPKSESSKDSKAPSKSEEASTVAADDCAPAADADHASASAASVASATLNSGNDHSIKRPPPHATSQDKEGESEDASAVANGVSSEGNARSSTSTTSASDEKTKEDNHEESWPEWEELMERCWVEESQDRPCFTEIVKTLCDIQDACQAS